MFFTPVAFNLPAQGMQVWRGWSCCFMHDDDNLDDTSDLSALEGRNSSTKPKKRAAKKASRKKAVAKQAVQKGEQLAQADTACNITIPDSDTARDSSRDTLGHSHGSDVTDDATDTTALHAQKTGMEALARESPLVHFGTYLSIYDKDNRHITPVPNILQQRIHEAVAALKGLGVAVRLLVTKIRQCGGTTFSLEIGYHEARSRKLDAVIIADVSRNSEKLLTRLGDYKMDDTFPWDNDILKKLGRVSFSNASTIEIDSAQNWNAGISRTRQFFLASETPKWARTGAKNDKRIMAAVLPSIPNRPGTIVISEGTPYGASGWQFEQWQGALWLHEFVQQVEAGVARPGNGWVKVFAAWFEFAENAFDGQQGRPRLSEAEADHIQQTLTQREMKGIDRYGWTPEQLAWRRSTIASECGGSEEDFDQYYPEDDVMCWLSSGRARFDLHRLVGLEALSRSSQPETGRLVEQDDGGLVAWSADFSGHGDVQIWEHPREGCRYLICCDPATGSDQTQGGNPDRHSIQVLRAPYIDSFGNERPTKLVARVRPPFQGDGDHVTAHISHLSAYYGQCLVVLEVNMGLHILELLKHQGVPLYKREVFDERDRSKPVLQYGFKLKDRNTKRAVVDCLALHIREGRLDIECPHAIAEMKAFMIDPNGRETAPSGQHDDDVMCLAMGLYTIGNTTLYRTQIRKRRKPRDWKDWVRVE